MSIKVNFGLLILSIFAFSSSEGGELVVLHKPDYVDIIPAEGSLKLSQLQHVISAWFGFTTHKEVEYQGILSSQPFSHPDAVAIISLFNSESLLEHLYGSRIRTTEDEAYVPMHNLDHHLNEFYHSRSYAYKLDLDTKVRDLDGRLEGISDERKFVKDFVQERFQISEADAQHSELQPFFKQLSIIAQAIEKARKYERGVADLYSFELALPSDVHQATAVRPPTLSLLKQIEEMLNKEYGDNFILIVVGWEEKPSMSSRKSRSLMEADTGPVVQTTADSTANLTKTSMNVASDYTEDYAAIFNIILWLMVFMTLLVIYVTYGMMSMDPGSDSIIYRMTTTRLKKD